MALATVPNQDNGALGLLAQIFQNSGSLFGSGTTTTKESTAPLDLSQSNAVLAQVLQGSDPKTIDDMIQGIMDKAKDNFGPNIANSLASGNRALTDTTLATIQQKAMGTATAQAAAAKLDAIAKNNQIAAQIVDSNTQAQAKVTAANQTKTSSTAASPTGKLLQAAGIATAGYGLYKKLTNKDKKGETSNGIPDPSSADKIFGGNPNSGDVFSTVPGTNTGTAIGGTTATTGNVEGGFSEGDSGALSSPSLNLDAFSSLDRNVINSFDVGENLVNNPDLFGSAADITSGVGDAANFGFDVGENLVNNPDIFGDAASTFLDDVPGLNIANAGYKLSQGDYIGAAASFVPGASTALAAFNAIFGGGSPSQVTVGVSNLNWDTPG